MRLPSDVFGPVACCHGLLRIALALAAARWVWDQFLAFGSVMENYRI
ncbi:MAG: hypothetical protein KDJ50_08640 [Alphaproteobacteria bacterium]|nr:hypothetical protein [Alphaproteobacteria bacterium]